MAELLAPAGSMEALQAAIHAGADAIYVGGSRFNARAYATNFDSNELKQAVQLCHLHGVRLFVTVNTLYKPAEIEELYDYLKELYEMQVDALIVQDLGLMHFIQNHFKDFEIHASTQCSCHNVEGVQYFKELGLKRVVVARENTLDEIKAMVKTGVEIEVFVHGALCVSYSGQCLMSQMIGGRSANRGQCAQPCRLTYQLLLDGKKMSENNALLSCKDLCTIDHIPELIDAGVTSFKIEGRMKRPAYVYAVTKAYREAIDQSERSISQAALKQLFNRDFTAGYLFSEKTITSPEYAGNRGIFLGKVNAYKNGRLTIKSEIPVNQGDGIRIGYSEDGKVLHKLYLNGKLVNQVSSHTVFEIDFQTPVKKGTPVYRTTSALLEKEIQAEIHTLYRKIPVTMQLEGAVGKPLCLKMSDGLFEVCLQHSEIIEKAEKPMDLKRIEAQLSKLGQTIYTADKIQIHIEKDCFIPMTWLNELRREACQCLDAKRESKPVRAHNEILPLSEQPPVKVSMKSYYFHFHTLEQLKAALPKSENEAFFFDLTSEFEKAKAILPELGLVVPSIANKEVFNKCDQLIRKYPDLQLAVSNVGAYWRYQRRTTLLLAGMNLSHAGSLLAFPVPAVLSVEASKNDAENLEKKGYFFARQVYGHVDNMLTKYCPVSYITFGKKVEGCKTCRKGRYTLVDRANAHFDLMFDDHCVVHVLSEKPLQLSFRGSKYLRFTVENNEEVRIICERYRK